MGYVRKRRPHSSQPVGELRVLGQEATIRAIAPASADADA
jgi:hypothetical protein